MSNLLGSAKASIVRMKDRLEEHSNWFPYPAVISLGLILVLNGQLITNLNPRLGTAIDVINFEQASRLNNINLWLGIKQTNKGIEITTSDRKVFFWKDSESMRSQLSPLVSYLDSYVKERSYSAGLKMRAFIPEVTAVLAVDKSLTYSQISPVITALAAANISKYGFETKIIRE